jgi:hypothetical protein
MTPLGEEVAMQAEFIEFGLIEIDGVRYDYDVVVDRGQVKRRENEASQAHRGRYGHTPLSAGENIPWGCKRLLIGIGAYGALPIMDEVFEEAEARGVQVVAVPTAEACKMLSEGAEDTNAVLHITC